MRHVPSLRESVIDVLLKILRALARQGNRWIPPASSNGAAATAVDAAQPMETDGSATSGATVEGPSGNTAEAGTVLAGTQDLTPLRGGPPPAAFLSTAGPCLYFFCRSLGQG